MKATVHQFALLNAKGRLTKKTVALPAELPVDAIPGEIIMIPGPKGNPEWYILCDKQRFWDGTRWVLSGSLAIFDPSKLSEPEIY
jgi:hypothetical protein